MTAEEPRHDAIIERYLAGSLTAAEQEKFEAQLLWDNELQDEFELTRRLREGMQDIQPISRAAAPAQSESSKQRQPFAMAASLVLAVGAGVLLSQLTMRPAEVDSVSMATVYGFDAVRNTPGLTDLPVVQPGEPGTWLTLLAYPDSTGRDTFRAELSVQETDGGWAQVWQGNPVTNLRSNTLGVTVRSDSLMAGTYRLIVQGWSGEAPPQIASEDYFRVPAR